MSRALAGAVIAFAVLAGCSRLPASPDFTLTDQTGKPWSLSEQRGTPVELFFGFTHCVDTCPQTLAKLARATTQAHSNAEIVFVTVDPERDSPPVLARFLGRFSGTRIVGLTGTPQQISSVERRYHVYAQKLPGKPGSNDYDEAHIATVFLIDADGVQRKLADTSDDVSQLADDVRRISK